jgi:glucose uptake protein
MILPTTYTAALLLMILTMLCWGSWANTFKLAGKWRFELFYYDYSLGVLIMAIVVGLTFGSMGSSGFTFVDDIGANLDLAKRKIAFVLAGGVVFNLANMLLVAAISVAGMAVAFPVGIGLALIIGVVWNYFLSPAGNPILLSGGVVLVLGAIVVDAIAYHRHAMRAAPDEGAMEGSQANKKVKKEASKKRKATKGIILSLVSGALMGSFYPLVQMGRQESVGNGLGAYSLGLVFAIGVFVSTFVYNLYFLNLPVHGKAIKMSAYFQGTVKQHLLGIAGGMIWCAGAIASFVASEQSEGVRVGPAISYAFGQGATMVSALWGLLVWKEFAGAGKNVRMLLGLMLLLFVGGLALISLAPVFWSGK